MSTGSKPADAPACGSAAVAQVTRTFRIFVSSTFADLKEERNALQKDVFPRLKKLCRENGTCFQAIDLRWGVREEAGLDQQTMTICLDEIKRCRDASPRPNFIVLLGDRYGWRPLLRTCDVTRRPLFEVSSRGAHHLLPRTVIRHRLSELEIVCLEPALFHSKVVFAIVSQFRDKLAALRERFDSGTDDAENYRAEQIANDLPLAMSAVLEQVGRLGGSTLALEV